MFGDGGQALRHLSIGKMLWIKAWERRTGKAVTPGGWGG